MFKNIVEVEFVLLCIFYLLIDLKNLGFILIKNNTKILVFTNEKSQ